jgi:FtsP/CotA-like multicopper oxidase with cupredoxin domain
MDRTRRNFLRGSTFLGASLFASRKVAAQHKQDHASHDQKRAEEAVVPEDEFVPVHTPDLNKLPYKVENGVKVFHLIAEPVKRQFLPASPWAPAKVVDLWGYNGSMPGPAIEVMEGDRVRIIVTNKLPEPTSMHWHGLEVPIGMDGVPGISQPLIMPGETFTYEFTLHQNGTFFYHSHMPMQELMGMIGLFIVHPRKPHLPRVDKDFALILQGWAILPNNTVPNTLAMEFNWLTFNGKAGPDCTPLLVKQGERVRIRLVNLSMDHHPIHLHGHQFYVTGTEGGRIPESAWYPGNTVLVGVAQARDLEFEAKYVGEWMLHCHLPHHMMNQMVSMVGPMAHLGHGMQTGKGMEEGMGIVTKGHALSEELGPSFGRGMGTTSLERPVSGLVGPRQQAQHQDHQHGGLSEAEKKKVPGYPQDMWMTMDKEVAKPETYGLPPGWTGSMMGMMTLVRVLPPADYEKLMARIKEGQTEKSKPASPGHRHED